MRIYIDIDGVLADFVTGTMYSDEYKDLFDQAGVSEDEIHDFNFYHLAGVEFTDWETWLYQTETDFWCGLPAYDYANDLIDLVTKYDPAFKYLSHAVNDDAKVGKHSWVAKQFKNGSGNLICVNRAKDKAKFATCPDDVLVDDLPSNILQWQAAGGTGILWGQAWNENHSDDLPTARSLDELDGLLTSLAMTGSLPDEPVGQKGTKPVRVDLIPPDALIEVGRVFSFGADKYAEHNFRHGVHYSKFLAALHRHLLAWQSGEDDDQESGHSHLGHVVFHCLALIQSQLDYGDRWDDRFKGAK